MPLFRAEELRMISFKIFKAAGATNEEAQLVSELLVKANLAGQDSHGVMRIPSYIRGIQRGELILGAEAEVVRETSFSALLNGNWGFGQVIGKKAMETAIEKAKRHTVSVVCAFNCNHVGRLSDYTMMAVKEDMIGIAAVNSNKIVAPYGGKERMLSTGPISYAFPTGKEALFILDISTSISAEGRVRVKLHKGEKLPHGWIINKNGNPSNDPKDLYEGGALLPIGGDAGYKGFGLGLAIDILSGILSRAGCAYEENKRGNGVFMEAINIESFLPIDKFKQEIDGLIRAMKNSKPQPGFNEILIPGEPEFRMEQMRLMDGIPLPERTWMEIVETAKKLGLDV